MLNINFLLCSKLMKDLVFVFFLLILNKYQLRNLHAMLREIIIGIVVFTYLYIKKGKNNYYIGYSFQQSKVICILLYLTQQGTKSKKWKINIIVYKLSENDELFLESKSKKHETILHWEDIVKKLTSHIFFLCKHFFLIFSDFHRPCLL